MSGYHEPLTPDEYAEVYAIAYANLRAFNADDVLDYTVEDCDGGSLWHLPRHRIETVVKDVLRDCQA